MTDGREVPNAALSQRSLLSAGSSLNVRTLQFTRAMPWTQRSLPRNIISIARGNCWSRVISSTCSKQLPRKFHSAIA